MQFASFAIGAVEQLGRRSLDTLGTMGRMVIFLLRTVGWCFLPPWRHSLLLRQLHAIGATSLPLVVLTALFTGMVLGLQGHYTLSKFGSEGLLGPAVALSLIRELGPVLTALVVTGRAGSSMAAEIGIMIITEQVDALRSMAVDPLQRLSTPRLLAGLIAFPFLTAIFDVVGIFGGYLIGVKSLGLSSGTYFSQMEAKVGMLDVTAGLWKSITFGILVSWVCCYKGFHCGNGAEGVGRATTSAVVLSSVLILIGDYALTSLLP
ncbi:MAG: MlaE family lipid ABC transporter permease subunit [bacterium]|nr:MlaE family lipid ABC transporter permease subunit [bacterium]